MPSCRLQGPVSDDVYSYQARAGFSLGDIRALRQLHEALPSCALCYTSYTSVWKEHCAAPLVEVQAV